MDEQDNNFDAEIKFHESLDVKLETIKTSDDFADYVEKLRFGYEDGLLEEQPLEEYLSGISGVSYAIDGLAKNYGYEMPGPTDWKWVARILTAAFGHS